MNDYYNNEGNNDGFAPDPRINDEIINANDDSFTPDIPTNGWNDERIENDEGGIIKKKPRRKQIIKPEYER